MPSSKNGIGPLAFPESLIATYKHLQYQTSFKVSQALFVSEISPGECTSADSTQTQPCTVYQWTHRGREGFLMPS